MTKAGRGFIFFWLLACPLLAQSDAALLKDLEITTDPAIRQRILSTLESGVTRAVQSGNEAAAARACRALALAYRRVGHHQDALRANQDGLSHATAAHDTAVEADLYRGIGLAQRALGANLEAIAAYQHSIELCRVTGDADCELKSVANLGGVYSQTGDFRSAAEVLLRGLTLAEATRSPMALGLLNNLAVAYASQGVPEQAQVYLERSLARSRSTGDQEAVALALTNLVPIYRRLDLALAHRAALEALQLAEGHHQASVAATLLLNLAQVEQEQGHSSEALAHLADGRIRFQKLGQTAHAASALADTAEVLRQLGRDADSIEAAQTARDEARSQGFLPVLEHALNTAGRAWRHSGHRQQARAAFEELVTLIESSFDHLAGGETEAGAFMESSTDPYTALAEMSIEDGQTETALRWLESARARMLVNILTSGRTHPGASLTPSERTRETALRASVDARRRAALSGGATARAEWDKARDELAVFQAALHDAHPELRLRRAEFAPFQLSDAALLLPDDQTVLVEFALAGDHLHAFVLSRAGLTVRSTAWKNADARRELEAFRLALAERTLNYQPMARALHQRIFGPIQPLLRGKSVIGIVPDGVLWSTPFGALIGPDGRAFLEHHAIFQTPSLTVLREMIALKRGWGTEAPSLLAVGAPDAGTPLPESRRELERVASLYANAKATALVGPAARRKTLLSEAPRYDILHLATHGVLNTRNPLYSYLLLSDGAVEAREAFDLQLRARLVVISACDSGLGRVTNGEGLLGLSWAFLSAGAQETVVSQWKVDSASTADLMVAFHRAYRQTGWSAARALRRAALETMRTPAWRHPYYWAGFTVIGSDRPRTVESAQSPAAKNSRAVSTVRRMSASECAADTKPASNCDGAR